MNLTISSDCRPIFDKMVRFGNLVIVGYAFTNFIAF